MVDTIEAPKPCVHATLIPPIKLQMLIYTNIVFLPYRGPTQKAKNAEMAMSIDPQARKPGERNRALKALMVVTDCSSGALRARMVAPRMQRIQPIQPCGSAPSFFHVGVHWVFAKGVIHGTCWGRTHEESE